MKTLIRKATIVLIGMMVCFCAVYLGLAWYYRDGFALNTWINGVYCTGKDVETVNRELLEQTQLPETLTIYGKADENGERTEWELPLDEMELSVDYTVSLQSYLDGQSPLLWIDNITLHREHTVAPAISYDAEALEVWCESTFPSDEKAYCRLEYSAAEGYALADNLDDRLDAALVYGAIDSVLTNGAITQSAAVDLADAGCYIDSSPTAEQEQTLALWEQLETYQSAGPVYDLGDGAWQVPAGEMMELLVRDEKTGLPVTDADGKLQVSENAVTAFIASLAAEHDTYGKEWTFTNTAGETVTVSGGTYGTRIDQKTETVWLEDYLTRLGAVLVSDTGKAAKTADAETSEDGTADAPHIPSYTREAYCRSSTTLGDTYIEVDMGRQKLYYYQDGKLMIETDIVTGNMRRGFDTPEGVFYVYNKQTNRVLRGQNYATPVDYWMPVKGAIGIHDADWRNEFGGDIYLTSGSHGCVNVPPEVMPELYELVEIGTPAVLFYGTGGEEAQ